MDGPTLQYNTAQKDVEAILQAVSHGGSYYASGRLEAMPPRLRVAPIGRIAFPILDGQAKDLIAAAERAPYGRGPETVLDRSVRDCWQIDADQVKLSGPRWNDTLGRVLDVVAGQLEVPRVQFEAKLYKLLVYEPGGFFVDHRDTEKVDGMVATLVVGLPAEGEGGELVVRHQDREVTIDLCVDDFGDLPFAAFYADCLHRTEPLRKGYRVSLVYSLVVDPDRASDDDLRAPDLAKQIASLRGALANWPSGPHSPQKLLWVLEHRYSEAGLSFGRLKGRDISVCQAMLKAAAASGRTVRLAVASIEESAALVYGLDYDDPRGGREVDVTGEDWDVRATEPLGCQLLAPIRPDGQEDLSLQNNPVRNGELLPRNALDDLEPDRQTLYEVYGNGGASITRSYCCAALVVWPRARTVPVYARSGIQRAVDFAARELDSASQQEDTGYGTRLLNQLMDAWPSRYYLDSPGAAAAAKRTETMLDLLGQIDDPGPVEGFLQQVVPGDYWVSLNRVLAATLATQRAEVLRVFLDELVRRHGQRGPAELFGLLARLSDLPEVKKRKTWKTPLQGALTETVLALSRKVEEWRASGALEFGGAEPKPLTAQQLCSMLLAGRRLGLGGVVANALERLCEENRVVDSYRMLPEALRLVHSRDRELMRDPSVRELWGGAAQHLLARSSVPPAGRGDRRIASPIRCTCAHCTKLKRFCNDPVAHVERFRLREDLRMHLESKIRKHRLSIDCTTLTLGRPFTLVCTKTYRAYKQRVEDYRGDMTAMQTLLDSVPEAVHPRLPEVLKQLREAIARSRTV